LLGFQKFHRAAALFLLGGSVKDAEKVLSNFHDSRAWSVNYFQNCGEIKLHMEHIRNN
jgi:hypothetical protein